MGKILIKIDCKNHAFSSVNINEKNQALIDVICQEIESNEFQELKLNENITLLCDSNVNNKDYKYGLHYKPTKVSILGNVLLAKNTPNGISGFKNEEEGVKLCRHFLVNIVKIERE